MFMQPKLRRKYRGWQLLAVVAVLTMGYFGIFLQASMLKSSVEDEPHVNSRRLLFDYPPDGFSLEQRRNGACVLHFIGLIYMFVALAIVCDEFFVPALSVITEKLKISEDVAGATFMAAGGSAPELFTSLIGVFFAKNNVGIGTIVGSAVFNILFVIGSCALISKTVLQLTWWPLFRDVTFYSISLIVLIVAFRNDEIDWWEALILFIIYIAYCVFMKFNTNVETFVKTKVLRRTRIHSNDNLLNEEVKPAPVVKPNRRCSIPILHSGTNHFRHGVLQLMIHTVDPISECQVQEKAMQLHAVASLNNIDEMHESPTNGTVKNGTSDKNSNKKQLHVHAISNGHMPTDSPIASPNFSTQFVPTNPVSPMNEGAGQSSSTTRTSSRTEESAGDQPNNESQTNDVQNPELDDSEPLDMSWPPTWRKRVTYVLLAPLVVPMWLLLPDTRRPEKQKWVAVTFLGSIIFIFIFSYLMVWWANSIGEAIGIPNEIMGLTILAAGTSIPDLITSVIVAKKGFGDMAVSSSVGSNIFDITVGLPIPWLLYWMAFQKPINVSSNGLVCSIILLFAMLLTVLITTAVSKWRMTKIMGGSMLFLYAVFIVITVLLELEIINCFVP